MVANKELNWATMQDGVQNSVVQVVAQVAKFNWLEPYNVQDQYESRGTGFFIDTQGHIVTNAHVVDEAVTVWIHIPSLGKQALFADIIGFCPERDLALLRLREEDFSLLQTCKGTLTPLPFGDSDHIRRTEEVLVLGYPLGHHTLKSSTGVVSGRESYGEYYLIQITAAINPGNSGGPLINRKGEVIGIAISTVAGTQNIGFGIPINELKIVLPDLLQQGFVRRQTIGFQMSNATNDLARFFGNPVPAGVYLSKVFKYSLAEKAGLQEGDMLYTFNDFDIDAFGDVTVPWSQEKITMNNLVARLKIGDTITLRFYRCGKEHEISFPFLVMPPYPIRRLYPNYETVEYDMIGGMVIMQLADNHIPLLGQDAPSLMKYTKMECKTQPILIISCILAGSFAQQLRNLLPGDIISQVNGVDVRTMQEFRQALNLTIQDDVFTIKTQDGIFSLFPLKKILEDEKRLAKTFSYELSYIVQDLLKKVAAL